MLRSAFLRSSAPEAFQVFKFLIIFTTSDALGTAPILEQFCIESWWSKTDCVWKCLLSMSAHSLGWEESCPFSQQVSFYSSNQLFLLDACRRVCCCLLSLEVVWIPRFQYIAFSTVWTFSLLVRYVKQRIACHMYLLKSFRKEMIRKG